MDYKISEWNGFKRYDFKFDGRSAIVVMPERKCEGNKWLLKKEYIDAFPDFEIRMLNYGYAVGYIQNKTRWCVPSDIDAKAKFCEFLNKEFGFNLKCMPVGMSCGGLHAVYFAAKYPHNVGATYLDAPVLNFLSCPCGIGAAHNGLYEEFVSHTGITVTDLINYRNHPIDNTQTLIDNHIPIFLINGTEDESVPYDENGKVLYDMYKKAGEVIELVLKEGAGHHPHGLDDNTPLVEFTLKYY